MPIAVTILKEMDERLPRSLGGEILPRREILKAAALGLGSAALSALSIAAYGPAKNAYTKLRSVGDDFSNDKFRDAVDARPTDHARLSELLADDIDTPLVLNQVSREEYSNPEALAEYTFTLDKPGPVHAELSGLSGSKVSLAIFRATIDGGEPFLIPALRYPGSQPPVAVQLGAHQTGPHRLDITLEHAPVPVDAEELTLRLVQGSTGTIGSFIDMHQPDIYPMDYGNLANNFPRKTYAFISETDENIMAVYWTECFGEDPEYKIFGKIIGSSAEQLENTQGGPTDMDWEKEVLFSKATGAFVRGNIAIPFHRREQLPNTAGITHTPLQIASRNNNVRRVTNPRTLSRAKLRFRPQRVADEDGWSILHARGTDQAAAWFSLCEHIRKGNLDPHSRVGKQILKTYGLDTATCQN